MMEILTEAVAEAAGRAEDLEVVLIDQNLETQNLRVDPDLPRRLDRSLQVPGVDRAVSVAEVEVDLPLLPRPEVVNLQLLAAVQIEEKERRNRSLGRADLRVIKFVQKISIRTW